MTTKAIAVVNEHLDDIAMRVEDTWNRLEGIRMAVLDSESSGFAPNAVTDDDSEYLLHNESGHMEQGDEGTVDDQDSEAGPDGRLDAPDDILLPEPLHTSPCEFGMLNEENFGWSETRVEIIVSGFGDKSRSGDPNLEHVDRRRVGDVYNRVIYPPISD
jgi:hypothetical protein